MLITSLNFGGAESQVVRLATELKTRGWVVAIVCMVAPSAYLGQLESIGISVHDLGMPRGLPDPRAIWRLRSLIREFNPDIVHSHMVHANLLGRIVRLVCRFPALICTVHNLRETSEKGGPTWHKELLYRTTDFLADTTTIICGAAFDRYLRVSAVPPGRLKMIPNGVDMEYFSPSKERRLAARRSMGVENHFVWLAVGRLVEQKDYPNLLRALSLVGDGDWLVLIAGSGPIAEDLQVECARLGLNGRVRFLGACEDILDLYHAADAFVMSSEFEGLSVALLEASSMGLPSVVTRVGGNTDVVIDGVSGYVVEPRDPGRIAGAMRSMMDAQPEQRLAFGLAARQHCLANYCFETITQKWVDLYLHYLPPVCCPGSRDAECTLVSSPATDASGQKR
jgi:glycosyltransferase involved in cell wall biosynthesis